MPVHKGCTSLLLVGISTCQLVCTGLIKGKSSDEQQQSLQDRLLDSAGCATALYSSLDAS